MKTLILILSLLALTPQMSQAHDVTVQIVYSGSRSPRPIAQTAKLFYQDIGVNLRFKLIKLRRIPRAKSCGIPLLYQFAPTLIPLAKPGTRTIMLAPAPQEHGRESLCGVAPICGSIGVATWWRSRQDAVAWVFIHELAHSLGAQHSDHGFMTPSWSSGSWAWPLPAIEQIYSCRGW